MASSTQLRSVACQESRFLGADWEKTPIAIAGFFREEGTEDANRSSADNITLIQSKTRSSTCVNGRSLILM